MIINFVFLSIYLTGKRGNVHFKKKQKSLAYYWNFK